jgi:glycosyltransferase involved in cell wall biosynthesis
MAGTALACRARRAGVLATRPFRRYAVRARTRSWPPYSRFLALGDRGGWSVDEDAEHVAAAARRLGFRTAPASWAADARAQALFLTSHFDALTPRWLHSSHRLGVAYMHGRPGTAGAPEFDAAFAALRREAGRFARVQVTHAEMHELVVAAGVEPERVHRIPLGIDLEHFPLGGAEARLLAREAVGVPQSAFVVGSFQKDGVGWGEGLEPKLVKGPDVLVAVLERLSEAIPELFVLLTGPARDYVRGELERLGVPYRHLTARSRAELARAYHALDVYVIAARQEGGPKAVLETLATGVPLIATRVGQAPEIVEDGRSALLADVEEAEGLAAAVLRIRDDSGLAARLRSSGRATAESLALERLDSLWARLLDGFVEREPA